MTMKWRLNKIKIAGTKMVVDAQWTFWCPLEKTLLLILPVTKLLSFGNLKSDASFLGRYGLFWPFMNKAHGVEYSFNRIRSRKIPEIKSSDVFILVMCLTVVPAPPWLSHDHSTLLKKTVFLPRVVGCCGFNNKTELFHFADATINIASLFCPISAIMLSRFIPSANKKLCAYLNRELTQILKRRRVNNSTFDVTVERRSTI